MSQSEDRILSCDIKDASGLNDFHQLPDLYGIDIDKVGINRFRIPLRYRHKDGTVMNHDTVASMYIHFPRGKAGINMSRLYDIFYQEIESAVVGRDLFVRILKRYRWDMRDTEQDPAFKKSFLKMRFQYPVRQPALKSKRSGWQYHSCVLEGVQDENDVTQMFLTVDYEYSSTCPSSFTMSKQYEQQFSAGEKRDGNGLAVPHSQRSLARCTIALPEEDLYVEDLVALLRQALPTETQSFVKRVDEQAFAVLNAKNPMFVEHASRRVSQVLNAQKNIRDWVVVIEHWESLHSHNAVAVIRKGVEQGLK